jgi:hypothetical protein
MRRVHRHSVIKERGRNFGANVRHTVVKNGGVSSWFGESLSVVIMNCNRDMCTPSATRKHFNGLFGRQNEFHCGREIGGSNVR